MSKMFSVVWMAGIEADSEEEAVLHAHGVRDIPVLGTTYLVREDVDNRTIVEDELILDRDYAEINVDEITPAAVAEFLPEALAGLTAFAEQVDRHARIQALLCAPWSTPELDDYVIPSFLLKREPVTYTVVVVVDPEGIAVITHREI